MINLIKTYKKEVALVKRNSVIFLLLIIRENVYIYHLNGLLTDKDKLRQKVTLYLNLRIKGIDTNEVVEKLIKELNL